MLERGWKFAFSIFYFVFCICFCSEAAISLSKETNRCLACYRLYTPGIVSDWKISKHSFITPGEALKKGSIQRELSTSKIPSKFKKIAVECFECHGSNPG